ncbi:MAG: DUF86 domain-containing protein [Defluviitaleaceae bacterium]|nr:DUF86 domain-containing protein [Defluviitaleaceae bacterium]
MDKINRRDDIVAKKVIREIEDIQRYIAGMTSENFNMDDKTQKAVVMSLINIGELSKAFSEEFVTFNSQISWKHIQATRNVAAYRYEAIDFQLVWKTINDDLPVLQNILNNSITPQE